MSRSFIAWLLVTLGLALLSVSVVLVPDNALADDGDPPPCGACTYGWDGSTWLMTSSSCTTDCECVPPDSSGTTPGEQRTVDCAANSIISCVALCNPCASATFTPCGGGPAGGGPFEAAVRWHCNNICFCVSVGTGPFCSGP
jgi:hypothetical protein